MNQLTINKLKEIMALCILSITMATLGATLYMSFKYIVQGSFEELNVEALFYVIGVASIGFFALFSFKLKEECEINKEFKNRFGNPDNHK